MQVPAEVQPALWGAVCGAAALAFIGFNWGGWVTGGAAEAQADQRAAKAVVAALAPICVANFQRGKDASAQLADLKKAKSWEQGDFVTKGGWATMPGATSVNRAMASSCADMIVGSKP
jgi:alpha/beta superfamily hydrolase